MTNSKQSKLAYKALRAAGYTNWLTTKYRGGLGFTIEGIPNLPGRDRKEMLGYRETVDEAIALAEEIEKLVKVPAKWYASIRADSIISTTGGTLSQESSLASISRRCGS
jgi:hypothetical protein